MATRGRAAGDRARGAGRAAPGARRLRQAVAAAGAACLLASPTAADVDGDNQARLDLIVDLIIGHDAAIAFGLIPEPTISVPAEITEAYLNVALKAVAPVFEAPADLATLMPNTPDQCGFKFVLPQARSEFKNVLGVVTVRKPLAPVRIPPVWKRQQDPASVDVASVSSIEACLAQELTGPVRSFLDDNLAYAVRRRCGLPDDNWGILGPPARAWHANTDVVVSVSGATAGISGVASPQVVEMPAGVHSLGWTAETTLSIPADVVIPTILIPAMAYTEVMSARYAPDVADALSAGALGAEAVEETGEAFGKWAAANAFKIKVAGFVADKLGGAAADALFTPITTAVAFDDQSVGVYDVFPPTLAVGVPVQQFQASDFGGLRTSRKLAEIEGAVQAGDACGREPILTSDLPGFLPLGDTLVTWRVDDRGPNPADGQDYFAEAQQTIRIVDTWPPLLLAPPSKVLETADPGVSQAAAEIGFAVAVDLADPMPTIVHDAPASFPKDTRTRVTWSATDASLNQTQKTQWITVKSEGTNTPPVAMPTSADTLTSEPVDIVLQAADADLLDGRSDPVWLEIEDRPQHGEFVAPLHPFFIEDFRTNPADDVAPGFAAAPSPLTWMDDNYCSQGLDPPRDFVYEPAYVHVTDAGDRFVIDKYFWCNDPVEVSRRISWWSADDEYIGQRDLVVDMLQSDSLVVDRDGALYYFDLVTAGSSTELHLNRCLLDRDAGSFSCQLLGTFGNGSGEEISPGSLSYARVDSELGVIYFTDRSRVYAFGLADQASLGVLAERDENGEPLRDGSGFLVPLLAGSCSIPQVGSNGGFGMEVDSEGALYVADTCGHRIHKFAPSRFDEAGEFVPGAYLGWNGRCTGSTNNACDENAEHSRGYVCTDSTCTVDPGPIPFEGSAGGEQGQFYHPLFLAIDPHDVLYVADYSNYRVQRFAPDGTFAGEAISEGTGVNQGDRPSFVLGNMGRPRSVSVNSRRFYVTDYQERFLHVFDTLPFKDITDSQATVTYVSNQDFHGDQDVFTFTADDGLAKSAPASVTVTVARNFRPPVAVAAALETDEEQPLAITLLGEDPDGILGVDVFGLDSLAFHLESQPEHGVLSGSGANWVYTPDPGYAGADGFYFSVDDGLFSSTAARIDIAVLPVNDPPVVTLQVPERIGVGFPTVVVAMVEDESSQSYTADLLWGDGGPPETIGGVVDGGGGSQELSGLGFAQSAMEGAPSVVTGMHTYADLLGGLLVLCVHDDQAETGCDAVPIDVQPLVALGLAAVPSASTVADGAVFDYAIELTNAVPDALAGYRQSAADVTLHAVLPPELVLSSATASLGSCTLNAPAVDCSFGTLANGASVDVTLSVAGRGNLVYDVRPEIAIEATTTTPALADVFTTTGVNEVLADPTDTDGDGLPDIFESVFGLSLLVADAAGDPDGDGLDNLGELGARTDPQDPDSDGDGLTDGQEANEHFTDPTDPDSDGDGMPDGFELAHGLDPLVDDADLDLDHDGTSNLDEYQAGTDPSEGDSDGDGVADAQDNCHLPNPGQEDANGNGIGDPCDCRPVVQEGCVNPDPSYQSVPAAGGANLADDNGLGAVDYDYELATTEVTNAHYADFLNAVASADDPLGLYNDAMGNDPEGGIERAGAPGSWLYRLRPNMANKPVNFVSWLDAARFVNWLENGRPSGPPSSATTEQGAFDLGVPDPGLSAALDPDARWSLASEDEWYKAAYFDPQPPVRYLLYPTGSNIEPRPMQRDALGNGTGGDLNYVDGPGGSNPEPVGVLGVGSGEAGSESAYGTRDQGGNVAEWLAADAEDGQRLARGGGFRDGSLAFVSFPSPARSSMLFPPDHESDDVGIRVVRLVPEPAAWLLHACALGILAGVRRRASRRSSGRSDDPAAASSIARAPARSARWDAGPRRRPHAQAVAWAPRIQRR